MKKKMTACEIIQETYNYYAKDPERRSVIRNTGNCLYNYEGKHCAIGRCLSLKWRKQDIMFRGNTSNISDMVLKNDYAEIGREDLTLNDMLMPRYRGHIDDLWEDIQNLHDNCRYWDMPNNRVTTDGHGRFETMMRNWEGV